VWDAVTWKERLRLRLPVELTYEVRLNRDGSRLATRSDAVGTKWIYDPARLRTVAHLWDARTGEKVAALDHGGKPVEQLDFAPAGDVLASVSGSAVRLWSAADGRLLHSFDEPADSVPLIAFSPSGKTLAVAAGPRVYWWTVADGTPAGPPVDLGFTLHPPDGDEAFRFAFETEDVLIVRLWNLHGVSFGRRIRGAVCVRGEAKPHVLDAVRSDGKYALTEDRHVYSLSPFRRLETPPGRKFPPEVLAASGGRRYVQVGREFLDLVAEVPVGGELGWPEERIHPVRAPGFGVVVEGYRSRGRLVGPVLVPAPTLLPPDDVLELWAKVLARGHIDPDSGLFEPDDEATWERNRRELAKRAQPAGEFPFPGPFASDPLFWLRRAYKEAEKVEDKLPLVERLVAAEPSWQNYLHRAYVYAQTGRGPDAIRDDLRAREMARGDFEVDPDERGMGAERAVPAVLAKPDWPKEEYELALRWLDAADPGAASLRALALYRLGRPADALRALASLGLPRPTDAATGLTSPWAAMAVAYAHAEAAGGGRQGDTTLPLVVEALCHQKLGRPEAARRCLALARELVRRRTEVTDLYRGYYEYGPVVDEALRAVQSKE
jgi:tetratricopeptide (TPR) repeat protein